MFSWLFSLLIYLSLKDREAKSADWDEGFFRWGCDRAVDGPQLPSVLAPLGPSGVGGCEAISELQWGLWGVCVTGGSFPHLCWSDESQGEGASEWVCVDHRGVMGILSLREYEEWGQYVSDLEFQWGSSVLHHLWPYSVSILIPRLLSGEHLGVTLIGGNRTRQQWPHWTSVPSAWLCALNLP